MIRSLDWRKTTIVFVLVGCLVLVAVFDAQWVQAFGRGGYGGHGGHGGGGELGMLMQLDLTDEQKAQIREMLPAYRDKKEGLRTALHAKRQEMRTLMEAESFDEKAVRQKFREMAPLMEDMAVLRGRVRHDIKAVLTPEQVAAIQDRRPNRGDKRSEHRRLRESKLDTWLNTPSESASDQ